MAKELPYFQFEPAQYLTGNIMFCSLEEQGLFINLCCIYWQRKCELTHEQIVKKFDKNDLLNSLVKNDVIKFEKGNLIIEFLIEQYEIITKSKLILSERGRKGGLAKKKQQVNNKLTKPELNPKHNIREDKIIQDKIREKEIIDFFNLRCSSSFKYSDTSIKPITARLNEGFTLDELKDVIEFKLKQWGNDPKMSEYLRPQTIFGTKFESYLNASRVKHDNGMIDISNLIFKQDATND